MKGAGSSIHKLYRKTSMQCRKLSSTQICMCIYAHVCIHKEACRNENNKEKKQLKSIVSALTVQMWTHKYIKNWLKSISLLYLTKDHLC